MVQFVMVENPGKDESLSLKEAKNVVRVDLKTAPEPDLTKLVVPKPDGQKVIGAETPPAASCEPPSRKAAQSPDPDPAKPDPAEPEAPDSRSFSSAGSAEDASTAPTAPTAPTASIAAGVSSFERSVTSAEEARARQGKRNFWSSNGSSGLVRHRLVILAVFCFSALILILSVLDLKPSIKKVATIDKSFHVRAVPAKPVLPTNVAYQTANNNYGRSDVPAEPVDGLYIVQENAWDKSQKGFADLNGKVVIAPKFVDVGTFHDGLAPAATKNAGGTSWGYIDKSGKFVIKPKYASADEIHSGVAPVYDQQIGRLLDLKGNVIFSAPMSEVPSPMGPLFQVHKTNGRIGLVDNKGRWVVKPEYDNISLFNDDRGGEYLPLETPSPPPSSANVQYFKIYKDGVCGVVDVKGNIVVQLKHGDVASYRKGHAVVRDSQTSQWGLLDAKENVVIKPEFDYLSDFDNLIAARKGLTWSFYDSKGHLLKDVTADAIITGPDGEWFSNGLGPVLIDHKVGYMNQLGDLVIKPQYKWGLPFSDGIAEVFGDDHLWRFIDKHGKYASPNAYANVSAFHGGKATVTSGGPLYALIEPNSYSAADRSINVWEDNHSKNAKSTENDHVPYIE